MRYRIGILLFQPFQAGNDLIYRTPWDNSIYYNITDQTLLFLNKQQKKAYVLDKAVPNSHNNRWLLKFSLRVDYGSFFVFRCTLDTDKFDIIILIVTVITHTYNTKINKYLELSVAMRNLWCLEKKSFLPLIISVTGIVPQSLFQNFKILDLGNTLVVEIQNT
jgi:hypothetical protein